MSQTTPVYTPTNSPVTPSNTSSNDTATLWTYGRGIVTGIASGTTKLVIGHPFDTIKVRMQVDGASRFQQGVMDCLKQTVRKEGVTALCMYTMVIYVHGNVDDKMFSYTILTIVNV